MSNIPLESDNLEVTKNVEKQSYLWLSLSKYSIDIHPYNVLKPMEECAETCRNKSPTTPTIPPSLHYRDT